MIESSITKKYAEALFGMAQLDQQVEKIFMELLQLKELLKIDPKVNEFLENQRIGEKDKLVMLEKILNLKFSKLISNFLLLVWMKNKIKELPVIIAQYEQLKLREEGKIIVQVVSVEALKVAQKKELKDYLNKQFHFEAELREEIREEILGGMIIYIGDQCLDGSILGQLAKFRQKLIAS
jgi:F-type H+-transporting ATPase subunit delta